jgi:hypothetical protein
LSTLWSRRQRELDTFAVGFPVNKERGQLFCNTCEEPKSRNKNSKKQLNVLKTMRGSPPNYALYTIYLYQLWIISISAGGLFKEEGVSQNFKRIGPRDLRLWRRTLEG